MSDKTEKFNGYGPQEIYAHSCRNMVQVWLKHTPEELERRARLDVHVHDYPGATNLSVEAAKGFRDQLTALIGDGAGVVVNEDGSLLNYRGVNYIPQPPPPLRKGDFVQILPEAEDPELDYRIVKVDAKKVDDDDEWRVKDAVGDLMWFRRDQLSDPLDPGTIGYTDGLGETVQNEEDSVDRDNRWRAESASAAGLLPLNADVDLHGHDGWVTGYVVDGHDLFDLDGQPYYVKPKGGRAGLWVLKDQIRPTQPAHLTEDGRWKEGTRVTVNGNPAPGVIVLDDGRDCIPYKVEFENGDHEWSDAHELTVIDE